MSFVDPRSFEAEQYRRLRHRLEELGTSRRLRVIAVTSAIGGEGKTLTALNLAGAVAQNASARVLIIDADLRRPSVAKLLGLSLTDGDIATVLRSRGGRLQDVAWWVPYLNVAVLPCAGECEDAYELLTSPAFGVMLDEARLQFDYVIIDTPPVIPVPDGAVIKSMVDGFVVVVSADSTPRRALGEALNLLGPEAVVGLVLKPRRGPGSRVRWVLLGICEAASAVADEEDDCREPDRASAAMTTPSPEAFAAGGTAICGHNCETDE